MEEQFYLLWPAILAFAGLQKGIASAAAMLLLSPAIRVAYWYLLPDQHDAVGEAFPTVSDALAAGCVLAGIRPRLDQWQAYLSFLRSPLFYVVPAVAIAASFFGARPRLDITIAQTVMNVTIAITIDRFVRYPDSLGGRVLNLPPLVYIGVLSYSLYLWQQPFLNRHSDNVVAAFPLNLLLVAAASMLSYYLVERPFLDLRRKVERSKRQPARAASP